MVDFLHEINVRMLYFKSLFVLENGNSQTI